MLAARVPSRPASKTPGRPASKTTGRPASKTPGRPAPPHVRASPSAGVMGGGGMGGAPGTEAVVKMRGLPYKVRVS